MSVIIAGILIKRLNNSWPLEVDATVQYAMASEILLDDPDTIISLDFDWWSKLITEQDLKLDSPYNTRMNSGLPVGPICNPGIQTIQAVVNYMPTSYWYYLTDQAGIMRYAETLAEHNQNIYQFGVSQ